MSFAVSGATPGATYYIGIKYSATSLSGFKPPTPIAPVKYTYQTYLNMVPIAPSVDSVDVVKK